MTIMPLYGCAMQTCVYKYSCCKILSVAATLAFEIPTVFAGM
jgi:hypothetical protein